MGARQGQWDGPKCWGRGNMTVQGAGGGAGAMGRSGWGVSAAVAAMGAGTAGGGGGMKVKRATWGGVEHWGWRSGSGTESESTGRQRARGAACGVAQLVEELGGVRGAQPWASKASQPAIVKSAYGSATTLAKAGNSSAARSGARRHIRGLNFDGSTPRGSLPTDTAL